MADFQLHPQLEKDCHLVGDLALSRVLLVDDVRYPWVLLVPRVPGVTELHALDSAQRLALSDESCRLGRWMLDHFDGDKLNVATLGNLVPQLHLHHVVRTVGDPAWPGPVWGHSPPAAYSPSALLETLEAVRNGLGLPI
jgi:diadenosine tetraphosphate (Ap4A) HIT family hydrolase